VQLQILTQSVDLEDKKIGGAGARFLALLALLALLVQQCKH
jgi:hypothetical protein